MVELGICRYMRKQSLFQRPNCCISQRGNPAAAAVVAAPIRKECVDIGDELQDGKAWLRMVVSRRRVRNVPLE